MAQIKGTAFRGLLRYVKHVGWPGGVGTLLQELPPSSVEVFDAPILSSSWYPYPAYLDLLEAMGRRFGRDETAPMPEVGRWLAHQDAGMIFKTVTMFASAESLLKRASLFWRLHCDTGSLDVLHNERGYGSGCIRGMPDIRPVHCQLVTGWIAGLATASGIEGMKVWQSRCACDGHDSCLIEAEWRA